MTCWPHSRHTAPSMLIAYDRDEAGERGAEKVSTLSMAAGIEVWRIQFPKGMDANEYALKVTPAPKSLGVAIRKAVWLGKGKPPAQPDAKPVLAATLPAVEAKPVPLPLAAAVAENPTPPAPAIEPPALPGQPGAGNGARRADGGDGERNHAHAGRAALSRARPAKEILLSICSKSICW